MGQLIELFREGAEALSAPAEAAAGILLFALRIAAVACCLGAGFAAGLSFALGLP